MLDIGTDYTLLYNQPHSVDVVYGAKSTPTQLASVIGIRQVFDQDGSWWLVKTACRRGLEKKWAEKSSKFVFYTILDYTNGSSMVI